MTNCIGCKSNKIPSSQAMNTPDRVDPVPYVPGVVRGKKWVPPPKPEPTKLGGDAADEKIELDLDLGEEYEVRF